MIYSISSPFRYSDTKLLISKDIISNRIIKLTNRGICIMCLVFHYPMESSKSFAQEIELFVIITTNQHHCLEYIDIV